MNNKTLSIVIPTIGRCVLDKTIESVLTQSVMPYEIVVWDNSGDGLAHKQSKYKDDPALKWCISEERKDIITSWNCAVECTSGEYVYILGDDDLLLPDFVEKVLQKLNNGAELLHATSQIIDPDDNIIGNENLNLMCDQEVAEWDFIEAFLNNIFRVCLGSIIFPRAGYEKAGRYKNIISNGLGMDTLFHYEMIFLYKKITVFAQPVWQHRVAVSDWSGGFKSKKEIPVLVRQYLMLRDYMKNTRLKENEKFLKKFERNVIFGSITGFPWRYDRWQAFLLLFYRDFSLKERYYILRDLFYLMRH